MAYTCTLQEKRNFPISLGDYVFYVEQYTVTGIRQFTEQTTVAGATIFTNHAIRARKLHLVGRFLRTDPPSALLLALEQYLSQNTTFTAELDGVRYGACQLTQYQMQEDGCSGTVLCQLDSLVGQVDAVTETG